MFFFLKSIHLGGVCIPHWILRRQSPQVDHLMLKASQDGHIRLSLLNNSSVFASVISPSRPARIYRQYNLLVMGWSWRNSAPLIGFGGTDHFKYWWRRCCFLSSLLGALRLRTFLTLYNSGGSRFLSIYCFVLLIEVSISCIRQDKKVIILLAIY